LQTLEVGVHCLVALDFLLEFCDITFLSLAESALVERLALVRLHDQRRIRHT
jgi:hypothetical protein